MIHRTQKKLMFLIGVIFSGIVGSTIVHLENNYSKSGSLFEVAHADIPATGGMDGGDCGCGCSGDSGDSGA